MSHSPCMGWGLSCKQLTVLRANDASHEHVRDGMAHIWKVAGQHSIWFCYLFAVRDPAAVLGDMLWYLRSLAASSCCSLVSSTESTLSSISSKTRSWLTCSSFVMGSRATCSAHMIVR